ncbi:CRISPR-associated RAMP protein, Csm3 family [Flexistipes sinusarabici DSM 4947]|uniref:CRISPR system Cms endoribonuclease Csm3 n=1 Tax=Flexistipes sinusarabici (strain ATCC 49648 / DSM 4947 / MAS 10) TaxID=717231 RepID=F8E7K4_FLESM|nr:type III-A CRISPR-associated RAMP protein Csm3 [Flexistipes sinusarabici]AEI14991.1 CRISPR-associated RAMP protein, Csm3 family [Flexistipes sinusarabici DSM 4947]
MEKLKIKNITGKIVLESGLHISGGDTEMHIGGVDNSVIKDSLSKAPYIPGSSLKGKVRSLLEYFVNAQLKTDGKPLQYNNLENSSDEEEKNIVKLFGTGGSEKNRDNFNPDYAITRVIFSDCYLNKDSEEELLKKVGKLTEIKAENSIDRVNGTAESPRFIERVPKGAIFDFDVSIRLFPKDNEENLMGTLLKGFKLLTFDALGGSGSRGYGKVNMKFDQEETQKQFDSIQI